MEYFYRHFMKYLFKFLKINFCKNSISKQHERTIAHPFWIYTVTAETVSMYDIEKHANKSKNVKRELLEGQSIKPEETESGMIILNRDAELRTFMNGYWKEEQNETCT